MTKTKVAVCPECGPNTYLTIRRTDEPCIVDKHGTLVRVLDRGSTTRILQPDEHDWSCRTCGSAADMLDDDGGKP
jgi:hypothetical protein